MCFVSADNSNQYTYIHIYCILDGSLKFDGVGVVVVCPIAEQQSLVILGHSVCSDSWTVILQAHKMFTPAEKGRL